MFRAPFTHSAWKRACLAAAAGLFYGCMAAVGAGGDIDGGGASLAAISSVVADDVLQSIVQPEAEIAPALETLAVRHFPHDKRQPRPPRHRGRTAGSFGSQHSLEEQDPAAAVADVLTEDDSHHRQYRPDVAIPSPLAGHPLEMLRPPSVCA